MLMKTIRIMQWSYNHGIPILPQLIKKVIRVLWSMEIAPTTDIGRNVEFVHGGVAVVLHERAKISDNVKIYQSVTLGGNGKKGKSGAPYVDERAIIYAGACVLGNVRVGKCSIVGANAVVLRDVPDNCLAVGVPAVIRQKSSEVE